MMTDGRGAAAGALPGRIWRVAGPLVTIIGVILVAWYVFAVILNSTWTLDQAERAGASPGFQEILVDTMQQNRPKLPAPHQVGVDMWETTIEKKITSKRSLVLHCWITLSTTLLGFALGTALGILLAVGIVHDRAMDLAVMPWVIATQTIPILAVAPMVVVVLSALGVTGLLPKAVISAYLSFFPVVVGMVKGLRSPDAMQMDLLKTYNGSRWQTFWKLRVPASLPFLFPSLKVAIAASLVGAIVAELPINQEGGLGARLLNGSYYGQTVMIWSALFGAAILAAILVGSVGLAQNRVLRKLGFVR